MIYANSLLRVARHDVVDYNRVQAVDIRLHGELVEVPSVVNINSADQRAVFGVMSVHDFYSRPRGHIKKFDILLNIAI